MTSSASVSFQVIVNDNIQMEGSLLKQKVVGSEGKQFIHLMSALESNAKIGLSLTLVPIHQAN